MFDAKLLWFIVGIILILLEFVAPGVVLVFFGAGAILVSLTTWVGLTPEPFSQLLVFALGSLSMLFVLRGCVKSWLIGRSGADDRDMDDDFTGREARVVHDIPGPGLDGRVEIKGAEWRARATEPIPAGTIVLIDRREGLTLHVRLRATSNP